MRIIPAIDIIGAKCVRLSKGDYATEKVYSQDPVAMAKRFEDAGIKYLHLVDLDGAKAQKVVNYQLLEQITHQTNLQVDWGGGIQNSEDLQRVFECGAAQVTIGSIAVTKPELFVEWLDRYGSERIILGADCQHKMIMTHGWQQQSSMDIFSFISSYLQHDVRYAIVTDIEKDGMLQGPSFDLYQELLLRFPINLIASGGVSSFADLLGLKAIGCEGAILGKALYENTITLKELEKLC